MVGHHSNDQGARYEYADRLLKRMHQLCPWWKMTSSLLSPAVLSDKMGGARVLIPDIYKGKVGVDAEEAHHLMSNLDFPGAVKEISEAAVRAESDSA